MDLSRLITPHVSDLPLSGIRRVSALAGTKPGCVNFSIGQPTFPIDPALKASAIEAIEGDRGGNGYSLNTGIEPLRHRIARGLRDEIGWDIDERMHDPAADARNSLLVTNGTSAALWMLIASITGPGDEVVIPDPYFLAYPQMVRLCHGTPVLCDTYPDFQLTAQRLERCLTPRTKAVILCTPSNPAGTVVSQRECDQIVELCRRRNVLLISDEIYDRFSYLAPGEKFPTPARSPGGMETVALVRGFGKTYGVTGWRLGYIAAPRVLCDQLLKLQQYVFVCAPTPLQYGVLAALDLDITPIVSEYRRRRDYVVGELSRVCEVPVPGGAFYVFAQVPPRLGLSGEQFLARAYEQGVVIVPGGVFSSRDTHFRLSYVTSESDLVRGVETLVRMMR